VLKNAAKDDPSLAVMDTVYRLSSLGERAGPVRSDR